MLGGAGTDFVVDGTGRVLLVLMEMRRAPDAGQVLPLHKTGRPWMTWREANKPEANVLRENLLPRKLAGVNVMCGRGRGLVKRQTGPHVGPA